MVHSSLVNCLGRLALSPCGLATYDMQTEMSYSPAGGLCLPFGKHVGILTLFQTLSTKKRAKIYKILAALFLLKYKHYTV